MADTPESRVLRSHIEKYGPLSTLALAVLWDLPLTYVAITMLLTSIPNSGNRHPRIKYDFCHPRYRYDEPNRLSISVCQLTHVHDCKVTTCAVWVLGRLLDGLVFHEDALEIIKHGRTNMGPNTRKWFGDMLRYSRNPNHNTYLRMIVWLTRIPMPIELREGFQTADASSWVCLYGFDELRETLTSLGITDRRRIDLNDHHKNDMFVTRRCPLCAEALFDCRCRGKEDLMCAALLQNKLYALEEYSYTSLIWKAIEMGNRLSDSVIVKWILGRTKLSDDEMIKLLSSKRGITRVKISINAQNSIPESRRRILRDFGVDIVRYCYTESNASAYRRKYGYFPISGKIKKSR